MRPRRLELLELREHRRPRSLDGRRLELPGRAASRRRLLPRWRRRRGLGRRRSVGRGGFVSAAARRGGLHRCVGRLPRPACGLDAGAGFERGHALRERRQREIALRASHPRERDFDRKPLIGSPPQLARQPCQYLEDMAEPLEPERPGLRAELRELLSGDIHDVAVVTDGGDDEQIPEVPNHALRELSHVDAAIRETRDEGERAGHVTAEDDIGHLEEQVGVDLAEKPLDLIEADVPGGERGELLEGGDGIAHTAQRVLRDQGKRRVRDLDTLRVRDVP